MVLRHNQDWLTGDGPMAYYAEIWADYVDYVNQSHTNFINNVDGGNSTAFYNFASADAKVNHFVLGGPYNANHQGVAICDRAAAQCGNLYTGSTVSVRSLSDTLIECPAQQVIPNKTVASGQTVNVWLYLIQTPGYTQVDTEVQCVIYTDNGSDEPNAVHSSSAEILASTLGIFADREIDSASDHDFQRYAKWCKFSITLSAELTSGTKYWIVPMVPNWPYVASWPIYSVIYASVGAPDDKMKVYSGGSWQAFADDFFYLLQYGSSDEYRYRIDLGYAPVDRGLLELNFYEPSGTSISWELWTSNAGYGSLAKVGGTSSYKPGDYLPNLHQYNEIRVTLTSDTNQQETPRIYGVGIRAPKKIWKLSTVDSINDSKPLIQNIGGINQKISFKEMNTKARKVDITAIDDSEKTINRLFYEKHSDTPTFTTYYKNAPVNIFIGRYKNGMKPWKDMLPFFRGRVDTFSRDNNRYTINVKDTLVDLKKIKVPSLKDITANATIYLPEDVNDTTKEEKADPIEIVTANAVDAILNLLVNHAGFENRLTPERKPKPFSINMDSFYTVRDSLDSNFQTAFNRLPDMKIFEDTIQASSFKLRKITIDHPADDTNYTQFMGTAGGESNQFCIGCRINGRSGSYYKVSDYNADGARDYFIADKEMSRVDRTTTNYTEIAMWDTRIKEPEPVKDLIEEILLPIRCFIFESEAGRLTMVKYDSSPTIDDTWTEDDIVSIKSRHDVDEYLVNQVNCYLQWDGLGDAGKNFALVRSHVDTTSIQEWGERTQMELKCKWFHIPEATFGGIAAATQAATDWLAQFANGAVVANVTTGFNKYVYQVGDYITIDHDEAFVKPEKRSEDDTMNFIILEKKPNPGSETINWQLLEVT